ncbi:hypothetical protein C806_00015 [Lachnospiraceae bacterium 3-1]|nr:hypothetical protein C806_00015 [Lachnospiraceae bacterium 3-1]
MNMGDEENRDKKERNLQPFFFCSTQQGAKSQGI